MRCYELLGVHKLVLEERPDPKPDGYHVIAKVIIDLNSKLK